MVWLRFFVVVFCFSNTGLQKSNAQDRIYNFLHYSKKEGLPSDKIRDIAKDADGLLWLATDVGLSFFDGASFHNIDLNSVDKQYSTDFSSLALADDGKIWIATHNQGLLCYDRRQNKTNAVSQYNVRVSKDSIVKGELYTVMVSKSGLIYFGGQETGVQVLDPKTKNITQLQFPQLHSQKELTIYKLKEDKKGNIWVGTRHHGLISFHPETKRLYSLDLKSEVENGVADFVFFKSDVFASYYNFGLIQLSATEFHGFKYAYGTGLNKNYYDNYIPAAEIYENENKIIAAHSSKGIYTIDLADRRVDSIAWEDIWPEGKSNVHIEAIEATNDGYWLGTNKGLFYYAEKLNIFNSLYKADEEPILQVFCQNTKYWYRTKTSFGELTADWKEKISRYSLNNLNVSQINVDKESIYFSTYDRGVFQFNTTVRKLMPLPIDGDLYNFRIADCNTVMPDSIKGQAVLWIGSWNSGLYLYDVNKRHIRLFNAENGLPDHKVIGVGKDNRGAIWLGMDGFGAVRVLDKEKIQFELFYHREGSEGIASNTVFSFLKGHDQQFWYASSALGIGLVNTEGKEPEFRQLADQNQYPWTYTRAMYSDMKDRIWMRTSVGVMIFHPKYEKFYQLEKGRGIMPPAYFETYDLFVHQRNVIWCTDKGLVVGDINDVLMKQNFETKPLITVFRVLNEDRTELLFDEHITLEANENNFSFSFSLPSQSHRRNLRYAYQLVGVDRDWVLANAVQQAVYTNIKGGSYVFRLRVGDEFGDWAIQTTDLTLYIKTLWYESSWFHLGLLLLFTTLLVLIFMHRIHHQKRINQMQMSFNETLQNELTQQAKKIKQQASYIEAEKQEKMETEYKKRISESELKAIRSQMNPHFIFNVLNSIEAYVVENDPVNASRLIHRFASLSRIVLENSKFAVVSVDSEIQLVRLYLDIERERFDNKFDYHIDLGDEIVKGKKGIPSMLIQPLVENAVHHGVRNLSNKLGLILIRVFVENDNIFIEILDNGLGFDESIVKNRNPLKNVSFGLQGVRDRVEMINMHQTLPIARLGIKTLEPPAIYTTQITIVLPLLDLSD